jgi:poly-gamma-glutamate capsule biosynthesis protein CapA/YwtB (metallophosphatase superfamily)
MSKLDIMFVGDCVIGNNQNHEALVAGVAPVLGRADIAFFNNEFPYSRHGAPFRYTTGSIPRNPENLEAFRHANLTACTLANNHMMGFGAEAMLETMEHLQALGIASCGAGSSEEEAGAPVVIEKNGHRVAFFGYNCIGPKGFMAESDKPGNAAVRVHSHYEPYEYTPGVPAQCITFAYQGDLHALCERIRRTRPQVDAVVVYFHWGVHFVRAMLADYQYEVGHACVDAGADAVLGCGPHILKGIEIYKGKPIFYSLGNLFMGRGVPLPPPPGAPVQQPRGIAANDLYVMYEKVLGARRHDEERRSMIASIGFEGGRISRVSFLPAYLGAGYPEALGAEDPRSQEVSAYVSEISAEAGFDTQFRREGDDVLVLPGERGWTPPQPELISF